MLRLGVSKFWLWSKFAAVLFVFLSFICSSVNASPEAPVKDLVKRQWISKAARTLRYETPITRAEMQQLESKSQDEILEYLMAGKAFNLKMLDFYLFYLGRKTDRLTQYDELQFEVRSNRQAMHAIVEFAKNNNFEAIFSSDPQNWGPALKKPILEGSYALDAFPNLEIADLEGLSDHEIRVKVKDAYLEIVKGWLEGFKKGENEATCKEVKKLIVDSAFMYSFQNVVGANNTIVNFDEGRNGIFGIAYQDCEAPEVIGEEAIARLEETIEQQTAFFDKMLTLPSYDTIDETDFTTYVNYRDYFPDQVQDFQRGPFSLQFWQDFDNSSTNFNRKRAAHILSTFFCDNLTPINIVADETHDEDDVHASDPACQSCHYKLDPMAGFFRDYGFSGVKILEAVQNTTREELQQFRDFAGVPDDVDEFFFFDDNAVIWGAEMWDYFNTWRDPHDATKWNIGYIRSATKKELNIYGDSMDDLFKIIQTAPEANKCMVKRLTQFYLGTEQVYSDAWLSELTDSYNGASSKTEGVKTVIKKLVTSNTFSKQDPDPAQCYDFGSNETGEDRPPCAIAAVLDRNCNKCHNSSNPSGNLVLSDWLENSEGELTFPHTDSQGNEISKKDSLESIKERINTNDPALQMPLITHMSPQDREALFLWIEAELSTKKPIDSEEK